MILYYVVYFIFVEVFLLFIIIFIFILVEVFLPLFSVIKTLTFFIFVVIIHPRRLAFLDTLYEYLRIIVRFIYLFIYLRVLVRGFGISNFSIYL